MSVLWNRLLEMPMALAAGASGARCWQQPAGSTGGFPSRWR